MFTTLFISIIILNVTPNQSERRILAPETFTRSYFCLSAVSRRLLQTSIQKENQNSTFEIILVQFSFQQFYNLYKIDVNNFTFYTVTFEVDDVFRYTMPAISSEETFNLLFDSNSLIDIHKSTDTRKFIYKGDELPILNNLFEMSEVNEYKTNKTTMYYPLTMWLRNNEEEFSIFEREINVGIKHNTPNELKSVSLEFLSVKCDFYKDREFKERLKKLNQHINKNTHNGMTGFIYQSHFKTDFDDVQEVFQLDKSLFFEELREFKLGELTSFKLSGEQMNLEEVSQFPIGEVGVKESRGRICWVVFAGISALLFAGVVVGLFVSK